MVWLLGPPVHARLEDGSLHNILHGELAFTAASGAQRRRGLALSGHRGGRVPRDGGFWKPRPELSSLGGGSTDQKETHLTSEIPGLVVEFPAVCVGGHCDTEGGAGTDRVGFRFPPLWFLRPPGVAGVGPPPLSPQAPPRS